MSFRSAPVGMEEEQKHLRETDSVKDAAARMRENDVGFLPVCDAEGGKLIGTLTDRDIAVRLVAEGMPVSTPVAEVMTRQVVYCHTEDDVRDACELRESNQVSRMVVLDDNEHIAGVISVADLLSAGDVDKTLEQIKQP
jgi:CBS domain-containing protein